MEKYIIVVAILTPYQEEECALEDEPITEIHIMAAHYKMTSVHRLNNKNKLKG